MTPRNVNLSYGVNPKQQEIVKNLREGDRLQMQVNRYGNSWAIFTQQGELKKIVLTTFLTFLCVLRVFVVKMINFNRLIALYLCKQN